MRAGEAGALESDPRAMNPVSKLLASPRSRSLILLAVVFTLVRIPLLSLLPVSGDEAYYWQCAHHPDWSYYDQPPLMIALMGLSTRLFGVNETAVRLPALLLGLLMPLALLWIGRALFEDDRAPLWAVLGLMATPLFVLGTLYASTDVLLCLFVLVVPPMAAVAILKDRPKLWLAVGVLTGLAGLAKFSAVLLVPAILTIALLSPIGRRHLQRGEPYVGAVLAAVAVSPALIWAALHHGDNILFQLVTRHAPTSFTPRWLGEYLAPQFLLDSPLLFPLLAVGLVLETLRAWRERDLPTLSLALPADFFLGFFALVALRTDSAPHWAAPATIGGSLVTARWVLRRWKDWSRRLRSLVLVSLALGWTLTGAAHLLLLAPSRIPRINYNSRVGTDVLKNIYGWPQLVAHLQSLEGPDFDPRTDPIIADSYTTASLIAFYSKGRYDPLLLVTARGKHGFSYLYWQDAARSIGHPGLFVGDGKRRSTQEALRTAYGPMASLAPFSTGGGGSGSASGASQTWQILRGESLSSSPEALYPFTPEAAKAPLR